jgi:hypothetical protein
MRHFFAGNVLLAAKLAKKLDHIRPRTASARIERIFHQPRDQVLESLITVTEVTGMEAWFASLTGPNQRAAIP